MLEAFISCWPTIVMPIRIGQIPICSHIGKVHGNNPKPEKTEVGSGADKSWIHPQNGACRISIEINKTLYKEKKIGICTNIGKHPEAGFIFSLLYKFIISWFSRSLSSLNRDFSPWIWGCKSRMRDIARKDLEESGKNRIFMAMVIIKIAKPKFPTLSCSHVSKLNMGLVIK